MFALFIDACFLFSHSSLKISEWLVPILRSFILLELIVVPDLKLFEFNIRRLGKNPSLTPCAKRDGG